MSQRRQRRLPMKRPTSVTLLGLMVLVQGLSFALFAGLSFSLVIPALYELYPPEIASEIPIHSSRYWLFTSTALVMGICCLVSSVGIFRLRPWAWIMALIVQGINLAAELLNYVNGHAFYFNMFASVIIVLYLNQRDIQRSFSVAQQRDDPDSMLTIEANNAAIMEAQREVVDRHL
jgi:hypothetical protein